MVNSHFYSLNVLRFLASKISAIFRILIYNGSFPTCWRLVHVTPIPKTSFSSFISDYRPIYITPILSKLFERLLTKRLSHFVEFFKFLPAGKFEFRKRLGINHAHLFLISDIQSALDSGIESHVVSLDFSAASDRVNHAALTNKLCSAGVAGSFLNILT